MSMTHKAYEATPGPPLPEPGPALIRERIARLYQGTDFARTLFRSLATYAIIVADFDGNVIAFSEGARRTLGYAPEEIVGRQSIDCFFPRSFLEQGKLEHAVATAIHDGQWIDEGEMLRRGGEVFPAHLALTLTKDPKARILGVLLIAEDITKRKQLEDQIHQLAFYDALTKLPNRRLLDDRLSQAMAASKRTGCYGALMFLDLDNFKPLNDAHGHPMGDLLLIEAASRLKHCVRETDTVARFGGDEFVLLLSVLGADKAESTSQARMIAQKVRAALAEPYVLHIRREHEPETTLEHQCTASIGATLFIDHEPGPDDILRYADQAMYRAKEAGRNSILFYDPDASVTDRGHCVETLRHEMADPHH